MGRNRGGICTISEIGKKPLKSWRNVKERHHLWSYVGAGWLIIIRHLLKWQRVMVQSEWIWNVRGSTEDDVKAIQNPLNFFTVNRLFVSENPIPVVAQSKAWVIGSSLVEIAGSNPAGSMDVCLSVCCECCVSCRRDLCDGPIPRPEESCRVCVI
jgi:hypothetical protein